MATIIIIIFSYTTAGNITADTDVITLNYFKGDNQSMYIQLYFIVCNKTHGI